MKPEEIISKINENNIQKAYVLAYFYNKVCVGIFENSNIIFNENVNYNLLIQIRIFNKEKEIKFVFNEETQKFDFNIIQDDNIENVLDEYMFVSGNRIKSKNDRFTTITQVGRKVDLPFVINEEEVKKGIRLIVRNYFTENQSNQVIISESRLVGFCIGNGGELIGE